jgi:hypothetical protein
MLIGRMGISASLWNSSHRSSGCLGDGGNVTVIRYNVRPPFSVCGLHIRGQISPIMALSLMQGILIYLALIV